MVERSIKTALICDKSVCDWLAGVFTGGRAVSLLLCKKKGAELFR